MTGAHQRSERRRLAALGALVGTAALVGFVVVALFRHGSDVLIGLVGLGVAVSGAWWVVTERMPDGRLAQPACWRDLSSSRSPSLGRSVRATGLPSASGSCLCCSGVTMACARAAMERDLHRGDPSRRGDGPPRRPVLLCNPWSGGGAVERFGLPALAAELGVETVMLESGVWTSRRWPVTRWRVVPTVSAWPVGTARRRWWLRSPWSTAFPSCV